MRLTETIVLCFVIACFTYYKIEVKKEQLKVEVVNEHRRD